MPVKKVYKRCGLILSIIVIIAAILTSLVRELTPWVSQYKADIEAYMSKSLGVPVTIGQMETGWYWWKPVIKFNQVKIKGTLDHSIKLHQFYLGINPLSSVWNWRLEPGILYVDHLKLDLIQANGRWHLLGIPLSWELPSISATDQKNPATAWIMNEPLVALRDIAMTMHFENGHTVTVQHLNLYTAKRWGRYRVKGSAWVKKPEPAFLEVAANMPEGNVNGFQALQGEFYVAMHGVKLNDWQVYFPKMPYHLRGQLNAQIWLNLKAGEIVRMQSAFKLQNMTVQHEQTKKSLVFNRVKGNVLWDKKKNGYTLSADHITLTQNGKRWPENQLQLVYDNNLNAYQFYAQTLVLDAVLSSAEFFNVLDKGATYTKEVAWALQQKTLSKVEGTLHDMQLHIKNAMPLLFLSRFSDLGWKSTDKVPSIQGLSGAILWQPEAGRLALDAQDSLMRISNQKPVTWEHINGTLNWQKTQHGQRYALNDFMLKHADLILQGQGTFDPENMLNAGGQIDISAQWSSVNAQQWLAFVPRNVLKKKLERWLMHDIKHIDTLDGQLEWHGSLQSFPYDKTPGIFSIHAELAGTDLFFSPDWPIVHDLKATLIQKARNMTVDIQQADLSGIALKGVRLWINDLGLNQEIMHVKVDLQPSFSTGKNYILQSPLKNRFGFLAQTQVQGNIGLKLDLAFPLYPEDNEVKVNGVLNFQDNDLTMHHQLSNLNLQHLNGSLNFQHTGVKNSDLSAYFMGYPVSIALDAVQKPKPATRIRMRGRASAKSLSQWLSPGLLKLISGQLNWEMSLLVLTTSHDFDSVHFLSDLKGLRANLPEPFGKSQEEVKPLRVNVGLKNPPLVTFSIDYAKIMQLNIQKKKSEWAIQIKQAMIDAKVIYKPKANQLQGSIAHLYLPAPFKKSSRHSLLSSVMPQNLPQVDLNIEDLQYGKIKIGQMSIKGSYQKPDWVLQDVQINAKGYHGKLAGRWIKTDKKQQTDLSGQFKLEHLAENLAIWDVTQALDAQRAEMAFQARWPGDVFDFSVKQLHADFRVVLRDGVISHLSKETEDKLGIGKLLSILSLQTIPRRLTLNFSDLANKGYSFDVFEGSFNFNQGLMTTEDSYMDGPVAYASMKGTIDISKRLYDLNFKIAPHITASLPIVATIAGGPIAGVATWVASKIINQMQRITAYTYKLSGAWDEPVVQPVRLYKAKK